MYIYQVVEIIQPKNKETVLSDSKKRKTKERPFPEILLFHRFLSSINSDSSTCY